MRVLIASICMVGIGAMITGCSEKNTPGSEKDAAGAGDVSATSTGGVVLADGAAATGGLAAMGGTSSTGGTQSQGGTVVMGGTSSTGGMQSQGGTVIMGGTTRTGGVASTGGRPTTGGSQAAGGMIPDAGPLDASIDLLMDARVDASVVDAAATEAATSDTPAVRASTCLGPAAAVLANAGLPPGYCAWTWANSLGAPRGIARNPAGDILVVDQTAGRILLLHDDNHDGVSDSGERVVLATTSGLDHGIALSAGYLYASSATTVYRWAYTGGRQPLVTPQTVVSGIPSGGHSTRTLLFDRDGNLYVSVGSASNLDTNIDRSRILKYAAASLGTPSTFAQGEAFATGLRNEVGLALDAQGRVWGVENGSDNLSRTDLGGDIHIDNPGEELNLFAQPGRFYGYPYCWTEYSLPATVGLGRGTQWAYPSTMDDGTHSDAWCRMATNNVPPAMVMQAHSAPLDIKFYGGGAFPADMDGTAIVTFHGSWNRTTATGYKVVRVPFGANGLPSGEPTPLLEYSGTGDTGTGWPHRPVGIETGSDGRLYITSDASGVIIAIGHNGT
jgi:glucose/arabinose dehydrogenase